MPLIITGMPQARVTKAHCLDNINYAIEKTTGFSRDDPEMIRSAKYYIGQVVKHRVYPFRGVIFDVDPEFDNTEEWYETIPEEIRPSKDQPFYHLFAENDESEYIAYVSEQNLLVDQSNEPIRHPQVTELFIVDQNGLYQARDILKH